MKKAIMTILTIILLMVVFVSGCGSILVSKNGEKEPGDNETRHYDNTDFSRLEISSAFEYEIRQADDYDISITSGTNIFENIRVTQSGETLSISLDSPGFNWALFSFQPRLKAVVTMPVLEGVEISGASRGSVTGFQSENSLDIIVSGASTLELEDIQAGNVAFDVTGASKVNGTLVSADVNLDVSGASTLQLEGTAEGMDINCSGASSLRFAEFEAVDADIVLSSASRATLNLTGTLNLDVSGASTLEYLGDPVLGKTSVTGASTLRKK